MDTIPPNVLTCGMSCANEIAECFVQFVRYPDKGKLTGPVQPSGLARCQRGRANTACTL
jgi:hypothetical protein